MKRSDVAPSLPRKKPLNVRWPNKNSTKQHNMNIRNRSLYRTSQEQRDPSQEAALPKSVVDERRLNDGKAKLTTQFLIGFAALVLFYLVLSRSFLVPSITPSRSKQIITANRGFESNGYNYAPNEGGVVVPGSRDGTAQFTNLSTDINGDHVTIIHCIDSPITKHTIFRKGSEKSYPPNKHFPNIATRVTESTRNVKHHCIEKNNGVSNYNQDHEKTKPKRNAVTYYAQPIVDRTNYHNTKNDGLQMMKDTHHERSLEKVAMARKAILDYEEKRNTERENIIAVDSSDEPITHDSLPGLCDEEDAFANIPISGNNSDNGWEPPPDASVLDKEKWKASYDSSINRIRTSRVGGQLLHDLVRNEVSRLKHKRHDLFCRKPVGHLRANGFKS